MFCYRYVCEAEMDVTRTELSRVVAEIARITPLTPGGNCTQSWPIGMLSTENVLSISSLTDINCSLSDLILTIKSCPDSLA